MRAVADRRKSRCIKYRIEGAGLDLVGNWDVAWADGDKGSYSIQQKNGAVHMSVLSCNAQQSSTCASQKEAVVTPSTNTAYDGWMQAQNVHGGEVTIYMKKVASGLSLVWRRSSGFQTTGVGTIKSGDAGEEVKKDQNPIDGDNVQVAIPVTVNDGQQRKDEDSSQTINEVADQLDDTLDAVDKQMEEILEKFDDEVLGEIEKRGQNGEADKLDYAPAYVNLFPVQVNTCKTYNYLCTRNNNFSNRSQKGKVTVTGC